MITKHAPSHLREEFQDWLESYEPKKIDLRPVADLLDALSDCSDTLPADYCDQLDIPKGSTYADAVADLRKWCSKKQTEKNEGEATRPSFLGCAILARYDHKGPYSKENIYFRSAVSAEEAEQGVELYVGAELKSRFLELEKQGWVTVNHETLASIKD